jgi:hypothetical protein
MLCNQLSPYFRAATSRKPGPHEYFLRLVLVSAHVWAIFAETTKIACASVHIHEELSADAVNGPTPTIW